MRLLAASVNPERACTLQAHNYTFRPDAGGFSDINAMSVDSRGFKTLIQSEALSSFADPSQVRLDSVVVDVEYSADGVAVMLSSGEALFANYAICTFRHGTCFAHLSHVHSNVCSLGVLQHSDVRFTPTLPAWKREAIHSMSMVPLHALSHLRVAYQSFRRVYSPRYSCNFQPSSGLIPRLVSINLSAKPADSNFVVQMGLYADRERGRYAVWQSLDHEKYFPGSGIIFVTVTVSVALLSLCSLSLMLSLLLLIG